MYLRGGTSPPPGGADFIDYHIRAIARIGRPADFNDDGVVDRRDLADWSSQFGKTLAGGDFLEWQRQLGDRTPSVDEMEAQLEAALTSAAAAVPEPGSAALMLLGVALVRRSAPRRRASS
jgi:hypothetical protein